MHFLSHGLCLIFLAAAQVTPQMREPYYCEQPLDHFDINNARKWYQQYNVYDDFFSGPTYNGEPVPLMVAMLGEGGSTNATKILTHYNDAYQQLASHGGIVLLPTHRYYGCYNASACPFDVRKYNTSEYANSTLAIQKIPREELQYLTSRQALADTVNVIKKAKQDYGLTDANKVIVYGGSYPGMLAAWMRTQYPDVVHAAVANSAPVNATVEFPAFNEWVGVAFAGKAAAVNIGGSQAAFDRIQQGTRDIETQWKAGGASRTALKQKFNLSDVSDAEVEATNILNYFAVGAVNGSQLITADYVDVVQENGQMTCSMCSVGAVTTATLSASMQDPVTPIVDVRRAMLKSGPMSAATEGSDYWSYIASSFWVYQTCNEFGFIQTCEKDTTCPFPILNDEALHGDYYITNFCGLWGIDREKITQNVARTNAKYGGSKPKGSCVLWMNGNVDPWHLRSINNSTDPLMPAILVDGASHHQWSTMVTDQLLEPVALARARAAVREQVDKWLHMADCSSPVPSPDRSSNNGPSWVVFGVTVAISLLVGVGVGMLMSRIASRDARRVDIEGGQTQLQTG